MSITDVRGLPKDIQAIALDLDGTLLGPNNKVSQENKEALERLSAERIIVTGRSYPNALRFAEEVNASSLLVDNSNMSIDLTSGKVVIQHQLAEGAVIALLSILREARKQGQVTYHIASGKYLVTEPGNLKSTMNYFFPGEPWERDFATEADLLAFAEKAKVQKIVAEFADRDKMKQLETFASALGAKTFITVDKPDKHRLEICGVTKADGLKSLMEMKGIPADKIVTAGDGLNDLHMIQIGFGVAMGNAHPRLKEVAKFITDTNTNHGVAKFIKSYLL